MSANHQYIVSYCKFSFDTLENAKYNVKIAFTPKEAKKYLINEYIDHYIGDKLHSSIPIYVDDNGNISFGRTIKY